MATPGEAMEAMLKPMPRIEPQYTRPGTRTQDMIDADNAVAAEEARIQALLMEADADGDGEITPDELSMMILDDTQLDKVEELMEKIVIDLRAVAWGLRGFFFTDVDWVPAWKEFQEEVLPAAVVFREALLLMSTCIFCHIKRYFHSCYVEIDYSVFRKKIIYAADFANDCGFLLVLLSAWYVNYVEELRKTIPKSQEVLDALIIENKNHRKDMMILKMRWTVIDPPLCPLVFLTQVGSFAAPFAVAGGDATSEYSKEVEAKEPGAMAVAAVQVLTESLIPVTIRLAERLQELGLIFLAMDDEFREIRMTKNEELIEKGDMKDEKEQEQKQPEEPGSPTSPTSPTAPKEGQVKLKKLPFEYNSDKVLYQVNELIDALTPSVKKGKPPKKYEISPALPDGLKMDPRSGIITGIPKYESVRTTYTITATNDTSKGTFEIIMTVEDPEMYGDKKLLKRSIHIVGADPPKWAENIKHESEIHAFLEECRTCHYNRMKHRSFRVSNWCDDLVALDPSFDHDMEFIPSYRLKDKEYVPNWIESQVSAEETPHIGAIPLADTLRDVTSNTEILLSIPRPLNNQSPKTSNTR